MQKRRSTVSAIAEARKEQTQFIAQEVKVVKRKGILIGMSLTALSALVNTTAAFANIQVSQTPLAGKTIPRFVDPLPLLPKLTGAAQTITMSEFTQQILPAGFPATTVWGYNGTYPGPIVEAVRGTPTTITYVNGLFNPVLQKFLTVDQTIHWADPLNLDCTMNPTAACLTPYGFPDFPSGTPTGAPVPTVVHLHGAEVPSAFDGGPDQWFTPNGIHGPGYASLTSVPGNEAVFRYPNGQQATTLWYHDHALGSTRINVFSGLAGFYLLRDPVNDPSSLPSGPYEQEILIQDRQFDSNGQLFFPDSAGGGLNGPPPNPDVHPFWIPEFFGDVVVVNGKSWPYLNVEPRRYRFRFLNGSNARMYDLALYNTANDKPGPPIWQIGTDGGFLDTPVLIAWPNRLFLAPAERADVIIDFSQFAGKTLTLVNDAKAPFPSGAPADPQTVGQIMQFRVGTALVADTTCNPAVTDACNLRGTHPIVRLADPKSGTLTVTPAIKRRLILREIEGPGGPLEVLLNNTRWSGIKESTMTTTRDPGTGSVQFGPDFVTELPRVGSTEEWEIVNTTADAHPIHIHLIQFQLVNRQPYQAGKYFKLITAAPGDGPNNDYTTFDNGFIGGNPDVTPFLQGTPTPPPANQAGWKDTIVMYPGTVTRIAIRWAPQDTPVDGVSAGQNLYPFDPTNSKYAPNPQPDFAGNPGGPGYVWHCHILDHEDNEMMRPYQVIP
jgi:spore coat protein A